jgi:hypothetical protein
MGEFRRITKRDDPAAIAELAARYEALLVEALAIARRDAESASPLVREILGTGTVQGLPKPPDTKMATVTYRAKKFRRTWISLIPWQYLQRATAAEYAESMRDTVESNIHMTESGSWPRPPARTASKRRKKRRRKVL